MHAKRGKHVKRALLLWDAGGPLVGAVPRVLNHPEPDYIAACHLGR